MEINTKKLKLIAIMILAMAINYNAQPFINKAYIKKVTSFNKKYSRSNVDTAGLSFSGNFAPYFASNDNIFIYGYQGGGFVYGSNVDSLNVCAQGYNNTNNSTVTIEELLFLVGGKYENPNDSTLIGGVMTPMDGSIGVSIYRMNNNQAYTFDGTNWSASHEGPSGSPIASEILYISACDTAGFTSVMLSNPISVTGNFAIEFDASSFINSGDTVGLISDEHGLGYEYAFHNLTAGAPFMVTNSAFGGNLNNNIAMFAVISSNDVGIDSENSFNGLRASAYPNPANDFVTINFQMESPCSFLEASVFDISGRIIYKRNYDGNKMGENKFTINTSNLTNGKYYYTIQTELSKITKSFIVNN